MSSLVARTGRDRQRYDHEFRLVAGCIPYRLKRDTEEEEDYTLNLEDILHVLMISSPNRDDLVFPKGGWEDDETVEEAACREALEEAGVKGILDEHLLGIWEFRSKSSQSSCSIEGSCRGYMFAMEVTEEFDSWAEGDKRSRIWLTAARAYKLCRYEWMQSALVKLLRVMSEKGKYQLSEELADPPALPSQNVVEEHSIISPSFLYNNSSSSTQRLEESCECPVLG